MKRRSRKQEKVAQWIIDGGIGNEVGTDDVAMKFYEGVKEKSHVRQMLLNVFKNWNSITDRSTLLIRKPLANGKIIYELVENTKENHEKVRTSIETKAKTDAVRSRGARESNFAAAKNHGIEYAPSIDVLVQQIKMIGEKGTVEDKLRLVGAVAPQILELAGLSHTSERQTRSSRGFKGRYRCLTKDLQTKARSRLHESRCGSFGNKRREISGYQVTIQDLPHEERLRNAPTNSTT